ncbi:HD-GYP domain-containing protein [Butyrivibrio sp. AE3004]|uniref:HD-GYP domain-containing protein n=1 Tax=Butyrivibrio sp. AE3004 TaxID=1506994 RepID=UPI0004942B69|nr:HD domain-containing phosphohydrolase [Butyrivibrio sp. AE3004]
MKFGIRKSKYNSLLRVLLVCVGIAVNVVLSSIAFKFKLPIYLDTVGTMSVAALGGVFPGIMTAVMTNVAGALYNRETVYFGFINALAAIYTAWFIRERAYNKIRNIFVFIISLGIVSGILSTLIQWFFLGAPQNRAITAFIDAAYYSMGMDRFLSFILISIVSSILDKGISYTIAALFIRFIPVDKRKRIKNSGWKQRPLSVSEAKQLSSLKADSKHSLSMKMSFMLLGCSLALTAIMSWVGISLYYETEKHQRAESAKNAAQFAAEMINPYMIDDYVDGGDSVPGYDDVKETLYKIRNNAVGVNYLYIAQIRDDGFYVAIDLGAEGAEGVPSGTVVPFEEDILPYINDLLEGKLIEPVESNNTMGWALTALYPIKDSNGICRGYAGADVSLSYMAEYMWNFLFRVILVMSAFFILILAFGLWSTGTGIVYPINSIVMSIEKFISAGDDQKKLDESVRQMRKMDIHTGDEIERMYHIICDMALNQTEKIRSVRRFSDVTLKMQDGLIITMADMVESRDSDTGAHIQKTAEYARIIVEGLERKGYYTEKLTPKFMSDVVRSAPLHDIGKINISDRILNKPGKLTPEEYEIMKTHTTAGREIIEKAISVVKGESYLKEARNMAAYHHERWDGKGYPEGLHGEVIPLSARIMAVADVFDALTSARVYKPAFPLEKALEILTEGAGTQFDPKCIEVFMEAIPEVKVILSKYNHQ